MLSNSWSWELILSNFYNQLLVEINFYFPKIVWALAVLVVGLLVSILAYRLVIYLFKKFKLLDFIDRVESRMEIKIANEESQNPDTKSKKVVLKEVKKKKLTQKINVDELTAKAISGYLFLIFFRFSIIIIWITEVEQFLSDVINYLPNLFIAICIWFFWVSFSDTVYNITFYTLQLTKHNTSKVIAMWAKIIILFFTVMIVLNYIKIVDKFFINTLFVGFVSAITIWIWIAFWLWWKDVARQILESFKN